MLAFGAIHQLTNLADLHLKRKVNSRVHQRKGCPANDSQQIAPPALLEIASIWLLRPITPLLPTLVQTALKPLLDHLAHSGQRLITNKCKVHPVGRLAGELALVLRPPPLELRQRLRLVRRIDVLRALVH